MTAPAPDAKLRELFNLFAAELPVDLPEFEIIEPDEIPQPYRELLVHEQHMTVTLERFHGEQVALRGLARHTFGSHYGRLILLALPSTGEVVQFGIMRIDLDCLYGEDVRAEILAGDTPLGRVLIKHDVLRRIDPSAYLRIMPNRTIKDWFSPPTSQPVYGRLATIFCNGLPAVELLEVVRPEPQK